MGVHVLAFTPTWGDALCPETTASVLGQRWGGTLEWEVGHHNPFPPPDLLNVTMQYQAGRAQALAGGFDALLTVEHDMVLPAQALALLWETQAPVAYAVYLLRHGSKVVNALKASTGRNIGMSLSFDPHRLKEALRLGSVVEVSGVGFGCTLIRRAVLEAIPFRADHGGGAPDMPFATDCLRAGVRQVAHCRVLCGHVHEGEVLQVSEEQGTRVRVVALQTVTVAGPQRLVAGETYELDEALAAELARAGYVRVLAGPPITHLAAVVEHATDAVIEGRETAVGASQRRRRKP